jgi:hypothetical protein
MSAQIKTLQDYCDYVDSSTRKKHIGSNLLEQNQFIALNIWVRNTAKKQSMYLKRNSTEEA